jgi:hypothetical protein
MVEYRPEVFPCNIDERLHGYLVPCGLEPAVDVLPHFYLIGPIAEGPGIFDGLAGRGGSCASCTSPDRTTARAAKGDISILIIRAQGFESKSIEAFEDSEH